MQSRSIEITQQLIRKGANIDIRDKFGKTPLMVAINAYLGNDEMIKMLIENGADKEQKTNAGVSCVQLAKMKGVAL